MAQIEIFFNTTHLSGSALSEANQQADCQNRRILQIMTGTDKMTPLQVSRIYNEIYPPCPETSIRRSMTVLTRQGKLVMLDEMVKEKYGSPNHLWKVV